jgi:two-component system, chemotaxis family, protein-glutamate methylesterase/glutaminase
MFRSAAKAFGGRVTGVVLSGVLDDGAAGLSAVKDGGGAALVQSVSDALYPTMPARALEAVGESAMIGTAREIARAIVDLTGRPPAPPAAAGIEAEHHLADVDRSSGVHPQPGGPSGFTCPECHGALWETDEGGVARFRCRTGHTFSFESLVAEQSEHVERALWAALRALEEKAAMLRRMSDRARGRSDTRTADRLERHASVVVPEAAAVRRLLDRIEPAEGYERTEVSS